MTESRSHIETVFWHEFTFDRPIRQSETSYEPLASIHPDTQGSAKSCGYVLRVRAYAMNVGCRQLPFDRLSEHYATTEAAWKVSVGMGWSSCHVIAIGRSPLCST
jgi:hypothetical protein